MLPNDKSTLEFLPTLGAGKNSVPRPLPDTPSFKDLTDPIHNRMKSNKFYGKKIMLRSVYGKMPAGVDVEPTRMKGYDHRFHGVPKLSEEEARKALFPIAEPGQTKETLTDGMIFDLGTEKDLYRWEWIQHAPQIVQHREDSNFDPKKPHEGADKEFYILVPEWEEEAQAKSHSDRIKAQNYINKLSPVAWYQLARLLGNNMDNATELAVYNYLQGVCQHRPSRIIDAKDDSQGEVKLFYFRLTDAGVIRHIDGVYRYNNTVLGTTESQVYHYLSLEDNAAVVRFMRNEYAQKNLNNPQGAAAAYASYSQEVTKTLATAESSVNLQNFPDLTAGAAGGEAGNSAGSSTGSGQPDNGTGGEQENEGGSGSFDDLQDDNADDDYASEDSDTDGAAGPGAGAPLVGADGQPLKGLALINAQKKLNKTPTGGADNPS
jgi:hypothetical protein